jgi:predicted kinase
VRLFGLSDPRELLKGNWAQFEHFDWVQTMQQCAQNPIYHGEGDVWTHTCMVLDAMLALPEFAPLPEAEKILLLSAALLHDVAKPLCVVIENGQITTPRHAVVGERVAREILWDCDLAFREQVCALVRLHGQPIWALEKSDPARAAILASWRVRNELTYILAKADVIGRIAATQNEMLYRTEMYRELCLENDCFDRERIWYNAHSRYRYFWSNETFPTEQYNNTQYEIVVLAGIAGSGKDTFYAKNYAHLPIISLDNIRQELKIKPDDRDGQGKVAQLAYERAKEYCRRKTSFVWNSTNLTKDLRSRLIGTLGVYEPFIRIIYVESTYKDIWQRRKNDIHHDVIERMVRQLEMPLVGEGQVVEWIRN